VIPKVSIRRGWPAAITEIADIIGDAAVLHLVEAYGGTSVYVPEAPDPSHRLVQAIGIEAAAKLAKIYGRDTIEVPTLRIARTRKALIAAASGKTREVALEFGVTSRWVRMVRNVPGADARQGSLFAIDD
jgi:hypothetical protein